MLDDKSMNTTMIMPNNKAKTRLTTVSLPRFVAKPVGALFLFPPFSFFFEANHLLLSV